MLSERAAQEAKIAEMTRKFEELQKEKMEEMEEDKEEVAHAMVDDMAAAAADDKAKMEAQKFLPAAGCAATKSVRVARGDTVNFQGASRGDERR